MMLIAMCRMQIGDSRKTFDTIPRTVRHPSRFLCALLAIGMVASCSLSVTARPMNRAGLEGKWKQSNDAEHSLADLAS
jgi:hypothetical protein